MPYKVVFVEDEVVTREGIRDHVDWSGLGFELCGEASDGEMALQLLQTTAPDLLITDIRMPFMDGLQLCKIVRERMPWVKIVILSGHDEFEYAQEAIKLGVTEYLLKPVTVADLHDALQKIAGQLELEKKEQENVRKLRDQIEENQAVLRERFLLKLIVGAVSPTEAIEKSQALGLDLIAKYYLVAIVKAELSDRSEQQWQDENPSDYPNYVHIGTPPVIGADGIIYGLYEDPSIADATIALAHAKAEWTTAVTVPNNVTGLYVLVSVETRQSKYFVSHVIDITDK